MSDDLEQSKKNSARPSRMTFEGKNERLKDQSRCAGVRADLKICLLESDCCKIQKKTPKECIRTTDGSVPEDCQALRYVLYECKRSLIDGRRRFRGPVGY
ncbi:cytochrome c oxidase assembly factor 5 [Fopius arisanus]|uniref:Cytochrome c oxidase assembly factor 5 n=1 Tax=Fopius arisanus TaxID=64838 RepID=A0A9R1U2K7_9HYME|nr:PREDICTED: cytochrome c oxidase assembly factor 5 [Fopius arisanus]